MTTPRRLELLHWTDIHGRFAGLARLSARARAVRGAADHPVLVLDGGDVEEGSVRVSAMLPLASLRSGSASRNALMPMAM